MRTPLLELSDSRSPPAAFSGVTFGAAPAPASFCFSRSFSLARGLGEGTDALCVPPVDTLSAGCAGELGTASLGPRARTAAS